MWASEKDLWITIGSYSCKKYSELSFNCTAIINFPPLGYGNTTLDQYTFHLWSMILASNASTKNMQNISSVTYVRYIQLKSIGLALLTVVLIPSGTTPNVDSLPTCQLTYSPNSENMISQIKETITHYIFHCHPNLVKLHRLLNYQIQENFYASLT